MDVPFDLVVWRAPGPRSFAEAAARYAELRSSPLGAFDPQVAAFVRELKKTSPDPPDPRTASTRQNPSGSQTAPGAQSTSDPRTAVGSRTAPGHRSAPDSRRAPDPRTAPDARPAAVAPPAPSWDEALTVATDAVIVHVVWPQWRRVVDLVSLLAARHGLVCYEPARQEAMS